ncbi:helix-turn-helix domain-containing protein [Noviherbaspirillum sp. ST9]|uniref:helix-turn-helix domain-containing protein n=1 Tax=Noviherbaspirillum sp. ST9 TaxID=3401606 RepID=UPI003B58A58D
MLITNKISETAFAQTNPAAHQGGGLPGRHAKLWSSLTEVAKLLGIPAFVKEGDTQFQHVQYKAGQRIYTIGQPFDTLYVVYSGFLKSVMIDDAGHEQVVAFPMKGDLLGVDAIHDGIHQTEAVALSACEVILIPFKTLTMLGRTQPDLEIALYGVMGRELAREQSLISALGSLGAEARVARFLAFMSSRFEEMGYSGKQFNLRMTREEIGNYLGLTLETISRTLSAFATAGLISVELRNVILHDVAALRSLRRLPARTRRKVPAVAANEEVRVAA